MKNVNKKRLLIISLSGFVLLNSIGCSKKNIDNNQEIINEEQNAHENEKYNQSNNYISENSINSEEDVINYIYSLKEDIDNCLNNEKTTEIKKTIVEKFIVIVDFVFYNSEIGGYTFDELTDTAKQKILEILYDIDLKIENKYPSYKNELKEKYNISSSIINAKYNEITKLLLEQLKEEIGEENYNDLINEKDEAIASFNDGIDYIDEYAGKAKEKVASWYQNLKEEY